MIAPRKIKFEAKKKRNENYEFRIFLKGNADARELDEQFHRLHKELFSGYDCSRCRNCCKMYRGSIPKEDLEQDAGVLGLTKEELIEKYLEKDVRYITCIFGEEIQGRIKVKATKAKMARGEMVRWLSEKQIERPEEIKKFHGLDYRYREEYSSDTEFVFLEKKKKKKKNR